MGLLMGQPQVNGKKIKGTLAYAGVSLNNRLYLPEELQKGDGMTVPLILNHASVSGAEGELDRLPPKFRQGLENEQEMPVGQVTLSWDSDNLTLFYEGTIEDDFFQQEVDDANMAVSLGMYYDSDSPQVCDVNCYTVIKGAEFHEVSLVYHPGFPIATIEANEVALQSKSLESIGFKNQKKKSEESYAQESPYLYFNDEQIATIVEEIDEELDMERAKPIDDKDYQRIGHLRLLKKYAKMNPKAYAKNSDGEEGFELMGVEMPIELIEQVYHSVEPTLRMKLDDIVSSITKGKVDLQREPELEIKENKAEEFTEIEWDLMDEEEKEMLLQFLGFDEYLEFNKARTWEELHPMIKHRIGGAGNPEAEIFTESFVSEAEFAGMSSWWKSLDDSEKRNELEENELDPNHDLFYGEWKDLPQIIRDSLSKSFLS
jgi:hypothetical protein